MTHLWTDFIHGPWPYLGAASALGGLSSLLAGQVAKRRTWSLTRRRVTWATLMAVTYVIFWGWKLVATDLWRPGTDAFLALAAVTGAVFAMFVGIVESQRDSELRAAARAIFVVAMLAVYASECLLSQLSHA